MIQNSLDLINIKVNHLSIVATLPLHHRDPFDRLLTAKAIAEELPIVGRDGIFDLYGIQRLW